MDKSLRLVGEGRVLVLAPHADDEALGCGALLADCWRRGIAAHVVCLTDGAASHPRSAADVTAIRAEELARAIAILGGEHTRDLTCFGYPDASLHEVPAAPIAERLTALIIRLAVRVLIVPSPLDPHCDHVATAAIAERLVAAQPELMLFHYPIWSRWIAGGDAPAVPGSRRRTYPVYGPLKTRAIAAHASQQGRVIRDDPTGFVMPEGFAEMFAVGPEIYDERVS